MKSGICVVAIAAVLMAHMAKVICSFMRQDLNAGCRSRASTADAASSHVMPLGSIHAADPEVTT
jgi:hypothetical protein